MESIAASRLTQGLFSGRSTNGNPPSSSSRVLRVKAKKLVMVTTSVLSSAEKTGNVAASSKLPYSDEELKQIEKDCIVQTYGRAPVIFVSGKGSKLYDTEGKEYIDMAGGIAVNALGHSDEDWVKAVTEQAGKLAHVSNLYYTIPQILLAKRLVDSSFADKVFYSNSGTEANEAAIKFARKYQRVLFENSSNPEAAEGPATEFVSFTNCFHGRTMGSLALTYKVQYRTPFEPVMPGASFATYGDLESVKQVVKNGITAAIFVEPVQGEGGIHLATKAFLEGLRSICDESGALLVYDEVQCGLGRTGHLFAHQAFNVAPDIMTLAKPLAGGLPIGAVLVSDKVASAMAPGDHGSTFAGNPLVCHTALATLDKIQSPGFLEAVVSKGERLRAGLRASLGSNPHVKEVRGCGLIVGVQLDVSAGPWVDALREEGVLAITAGKGDVLRLVPPLVVTEEEIDAVVERMARTIRVVG